MLETEIAEDPVEQQTVRVLGAKSKLLLRVVCACAVPWRVYRSGFYVA